MEKCKCEKAGFCPCRKNADGTLGCEMSQHLWHLCQTREDYRALFWGIELPFAPSRRIYNFSLTCLNQALPHAHADLAPYCDTNTRLVETSAGIWQGSCKTYSKSIVGSCSSQITFIPANTPTWSLRVWGGSCEGSQGLLILLNRGGSVIKAEKKVRYIDEIEIVGGKYKYSIT
jgi:hypothetical protein